MGWAYGRNMEGREVGYSVEATCDKDGCGEKIDRGVDYLCGELEGGGEYGCGGYFCGEHLGYGNCEQLCMPCLDALAAGSD